MTTPLPVVVPPRPPAKLPPILARWTQEILGELPPSEPRSTCDACVKLAKPGEEYGPRHYHPDTKCCTYLPVLLNFQVGLILDDPEVSEQGKRSVEWRIEQGEGVSPVGLTTTPSYDIRYNDDSFGRDPGLMCPHYLQESGGCGVWHQRNAVCATWFCRSDRGGASFSFWRLGYLRFLRAVEDAVAEWCMFALGAEEEEWGPWSDKRAYYRAAGRLADKLSWKDTLQLGGSKIATRGEQAAILYKQMMGAPIVPEELADGRGPVEATEESLRAAETFRAELQKDKDELL